MGICGKQGRDLLVCPLGEAILGLVVRWELGMCCGVVGWLLMRELEMFGGDVGHVSAPRRCQILKR
jgi:hypothetical protein